MRFKLTISSICLLLLAFCPIPLLAQYPWVYQVSNSASYYGSNLPGYGIAQGSIMVLMGSQIGPAQLLQYSGFPLPLELGETSIEVTVNGVTRKAPIFYTSYGQVAALLPSSVPTGQGTLVLTYKNQKAYPETIQVVPSAFGIYSLLSNGLGAGVVTTPDYQVRTLSDSSQPGDALILWGTGLGAVSGDDSLGPLPGDNFPGTEVYVGNQRARLLYAGRSGCCAGLDQINFEVPAGVQGCFVPISVRNGGVTSNFVTVPIASSGGPCSDPVGLPSALLRAAQSGTTVNVGVITLAPIRLLPQAMHELARSLASRLSAELHLSVTEEQMNEVFRASGPDRRKAVLEIIRNGGGNQPDRRSAARAIAHVVAGFNEESSFAQFIGLSSMGQMVTTFGQILPAPGLCTVYPDHLGYWNPPKKALDAGKQLVLSGPLGSKTLQSTAKGVYQIPAGSGYSTDHLPGGVYTVTSTGGADVGAFTASITIGSNLSWTNKPANEVVDRSVPLWVTWSGGPATGYVLFGGSATSDTTGVNRTFACVEDIRKGQLTVPTYVLGALPPSLKNKGYLFLGMHPLQSAFTARGLDAAYLADLNSDNTTIEFR